MNDEITAYPLTWPDGRPRHRGARVRAAFGRRDYGLGALGGTRFRELSVADAVDRLQTEVVRMGGTSRLVISTNVPVRRDGLPRSNQEPGDPGVAVYFTRTKKPYCLACDRWDRVADNIAAIAAHIAALRGIERWGCGTIEQAFTGYLALADFSVDWRAHFPKAETLEAVEEAYAKKAKALHPDVGGEHEEMVRLNRAREAAREEFTGGTA